MSMLRTTDEATEARNEPTDWIRLLAWMSIIGASLDAIAMVIIAVLIPPLVIGLVLTVAGLALLRRRPRGGVWMLGIVALLLGITSAPFALPDVPHPESAVSFVHAVGHLLTRAVAVIAALGALRAASPTGVKPIRTIALAGLAATVVVGMVASVATTSDTPEDGDVVVEVTSAEFPAVVEVVTGEAVFVENDDYIRHTFSVEGTSVDRELPARTGVRIEVDLDPGTYRLICEVAGHESMEADLVVGRI